MKYRGASFLGNYEQALLRQYLGCPCKMRDGIAPIVWLNLHWPSMCLIRHHHSIVTHSAYEHPIRKPSGTYPGEIE
jgi:hypothetical protein